MKKKIEKIIYKYLEEFLPVDILVKKQYPDLGDDRSLETFLGEEIAGQVFILFKASLDRIKLEKRDSDKIGRGAGLEGSMFRSEDTGYNNAVSEIDNKIEIEKGGEL